VQRYNARSGDTSPSVDTFNNLAEQPRENGHEAKVRNDNPNRTPSGPYLELGECLNQDHQQMLLEESGLPQEIVRARGYRTVATKSELRRLGFADSQCNAPGLLVPIHSPAGEVVNYQFRPDMPRISDGRPVKYETPKGSRMTLDVHPFAREGLGDPSIPLWITEGIKKGDALVGRGLCVVTLLGVWNWRGTNGQGGKVALPGVGVHRSQRQAGLHSLRLGRDDEAAGPRGPRAAQGFLGGEVMAEVQLIYLPHGEDGGKRGVDDFLAAGNTVDDLIALAATELREPPQVEDDTPPIPYRETTHGLVWERPTREGAIPTPLTNFNARIVSDIVEDDGAEQWRRFEIEAELNGRRSGFTVPAERFFGMGWPPEHLGAAAIVYPGFGTKDHARAAVQMVSGDIAVRQTFAHTGWREIGGQ
jgi:hypothetical protein